MGRRGLGSGLAMGCRPTRRELCKKKSTGARVRDKELTGGDCRRVHRWQWLIRCLSIFHVPGVVLCVLLDANLRHLAGEEAASAVGCREKDENV